jgi:hypothetical protein
MQCDRRGIAKRGSQAIRPRRPLGSPLHYNDLDLRFGPLGMGFGSGEASSLAPCSTRSLAHREEPGPPKPTIYPRSNAVAKPSMLSLSLAKADATSIATAM